MEREDSVITAAIWRLWSIKRHAESIMREVRQYSEQFCNQYLMSLKTKILFTNFDSLGVGFIKSKFN